MSTVPRLVYRPQGANVNNSGHRTGLEPQSVQLPQADIAHQTRLGLWDGWPETKLPKCREAIDKAGMGERTIIQSLFDVPPSAKEIANKLLYHGWWSWPSRDRLIDMTGLDSTNVSRALGQLERANIISLRRTYSGGGKVRIEYVFQGLAVLIAIAKGGNLKLRYPALKLLCEYLRRCQSDNRAVVNLTTAPRFKSDTNSGGEQETYKNKKRGIISPNKEDQVINVEGGGLASGGRVWIGDWSIPVCCNCCLITDLGDTCPMCGRHERRIPTERSTAPYCAMLEHGIDPVVVDELAGSAGIK